MSVQVKPLTDSCRFTRRLAQYFDLSERPVELLIRRRDQLQCTIAYDGVLESQSIPHSIKGEWH